ncbi:Putative cyclin-D6-1 [Striga hermonthica]|uniref:Cyclin-D6-1 n=1 Tax=Striga hermonthica TaxID=68872 RepID=A0A9N7R2T9_STRHE|nr:Putative cyclin-D6-1 [Striga hermonthica]
MEFDLENPLPPSDDTFPLLFKMESDHMPAKTYSQSLDSKGSNRTIRSEIMSSISHFSGKFDPFLKYLAVNYMDRFLSTHSIPDGKLWIFDLVAIACVSLGLKMRKTEFSVSDLIQDGDFMFDSSTINRMELLILGALKWRMRSANPFCFLSYFITFVTFIDKYSVPNLKKRATEIILKAPNDVKLLEFKPSLISASALLCAVNEFFPVQFPSFKNAVCSCSYVDKEDFLQCYDKIQGVAIEGCESLWALALGSCTGQALQDMSVVPSISGSKVDNNNNDGDNN